MYKITQKLLASLIITLMLVTQVNIVQAEEITPPVAVTVAPSAPTPPPAPSAPTPPPAPSIPAAPTPAPTKAPSAPTPPPTPKPKASSEPSATPAPSVTPSATPAPSATPSPDANSASSQNGAGSNSNSGNNSNQVGNAAVVTGNANNSVDSTVNGNNNLAADSSNLNLGSGNNIVTSGNGANSNNTTNLTSNSDKSLVQDNNATVNNNVDQNTNTGNNTASGNVGNAVIKTGDSNTSGTLVTALNTNVSGVQVSEFNVADNHTGDIILDFNAACVSGCGNGSNLANTGNGSGSTNNNTLNTNSNDATFQNNNANVSNNMVLGSNSGNNNADKNTDGDSTIVTGDANVSASALTFANNNIQGNVVYGVVNIYGDLHGNIILPEEAVASAGNNNCSSGCQAPVTAKNVGNGAGSTNSNDVNQTNNDVAFQNNDANIQNNINVNATTGNNSTSKNTGGDSAVVTGNANVQSSTLNIANNNIDGGTWWLAIVNDGGKWVGKIMGAPDGATMSGSAGTEFSLNDKGEIVAVNNGNGSGSTNSNSYDQTNNSTLTQNNNANVVNNLNLSANTGGNSASKNTGGNSAVVTGDANIIANLVNFVNNNIKGNGKLIVTVVNVFGNWDGNFCIPGLPCPKNNSNPTNVGGANPAAANNPAVNPITTTQNVSSTPTSNQNINPEDIKVVTEDTTRPSPNPSLQKLIVKRLVANNMNSQFFGTPGLTEDVMGVSNHQLVDSNIGTSTSSNKSATNTPDPVKFNLAWLISMLPGLLGFLVTRNFNAIKHYVLMLVL